MSTSGTAASDMLAGRPDLQERDEWPEEIVEPRSDLETERSFRRRVGFVPRMVPYVSPHPWAHQPVLFLVDPCLQALDRDLFMQICFVVARDHACRYCYGSLRAFLRVAGYSESEIDRLENELYLHGRREAKRDISAFAVGISKGRLQHEDVIGKLRAAGYEETVIREIAGSALLDTITTRMATMLAAPIEVGLEEATTPWYFDWIQPVAKSVLAAWRRLGSAPRLPLTAEGAEGPFAPWLLRLQGTPVGGLLHDLTNRWWETDHGLPMRTKLLLLAVVARALSCEELSAQARTLLSKRCGLPGDAFEATVEHLRADALSDPEARLLKLARASVRYDPRRLQPAARKRTDALSREETIDAVATIGLSNALARLGTLDSLDP